MSDDLGTLGADLVIVIPLWRRKVNIARVYESAFAVTPLAHILFVVSEGDVGVREACVAFDVAMLVVPGPGGMGGDYATKINAGYRATKEPYIFTGADDLVFTPGWYGAAKALISPTNEPRTVVNETAPLGALAPAIGVVGTVDGCNDRTKLGEHSTHSLVARWYADCCAVVDAPGSIYSQAYEHEYCDDELCQTAMSKGAYAHAFDALVEHHHPNHPSLGVADDETYQRGRSRTRRSRHTFMLRRRLWAR